MPKVQKKVILKMAPSKAKGDSGGTLERHLEVQDLPKLIAEGWQVVSTTPPDEDGNATITLEREEP